MLNRRDGLQGPLLEGKGRGQEPEDGCGGRFETVSLNKELIILGLMIFGTKIIDNFGAKKESSLFP